MKHLVFALLVFFITFNANANEQKELEVMHIFKQYFLDWGIDIEKDYHRLSKKNKLRVDTLPIIAHWVVYWTEHFENNEGKFGGKLPNYQYNHLLVAVVITVETGCNPKRRGSKKGEVGLMQIHGPALAGYAKKHVLKEPELGIKLGVQWLAHQTTLCYQNPQKWRMWHWTKPLSVYGAGKKALLGKGKCKSIRSAKRRIRIMRRYQRKM